MPGYVAGRDAREARVVIHDLVLGLDEGVVYGAALYVHHRHFGALETPHCIAHFAVHRKHPIGAIQRMAFARLGAHVILERSVGAAHDAVPHVNGPPGAARGAFLAPAAVVFFLSVVFLSWRVDSSQSTPVVSALFTCDVFVGGGIENVTTSYTCAFILHAVRHGPRAGLVQLVMWRRLLIEHVTQFLRVQAVSGIAGTTGTLSAVVGFILGYEFPSVDVKLGLLVADGVTGRSGALVDHDGTIAVNRLHRIPIQQ